MDLIRKRKTLTEPEARFFLVQIIGAVKFMHSMGVIHRDLKLGNIFLDAHMNIKIGDFGLAALLYSKSERKKTICGTPNYIAPEVLYGRDKGHSYEVDIWSIGIILYVMLVGKPPFQSRSVETIYERIKMNDYEIPMKAKVSQNAQKLITSLLTTDPSARPTLDDVLKNPFFDGDFPEALDPGIITEVPTRFFNMSPKDAHRNFVNCMIDAQIIDEDADVVFTKHPSGMNVEEMVAQTVRDPRSRHSILPNTLSPATTKEKYKEVVVQATTKSRRAERGDDYEDTRGRGKNTIESDPYAMAPKTKPRQTYYETVDGESAGNEEEEEQLVCYSPEVPVSVAMPPVTINGITTMYMDYPRIPDPFSIFDYGSSVISTLLKTELPEYHIASLEGLPPPQIVYITKWVDYSNRYGIGYELSNGTAGVLRPDGSSIQLNTVTQAFDTIQFDDTLNCMTIQRVSNLNETEISGADHKNLNLAYSMHSYMEEHLRMCGDVGSECIDSGYERQLYEAQQIEHAQQYEEKVTPPDVNNPEGVVYLLDFFRLGDSYLFQLSNGDCQVNFADHTKFVFEAHGEGVALINSDSIHYLGTKSGHVCCEQLYERLCEDDLALNFIKDKMLSCKKMLQTES